MFHLLSVPPNHFRRILKLKVGNCVVLFLNLFSSIHSLFFKHDRDQLQSSNKRLSVGVTCVGIFQLLQEIYEFTCFLQFPLLLIC